MPDSRQLLRQSAMSLRVPVEIIRAEFEASGLTKTELARRLGWYRGAAGSARRRGLTTVPDVDRVDRVLGQRVQNYSRGYGNQTRRAVNAATAAAIRAALAREAADVR